MEQVQPWQVLTVGGVVIIIGVLWLVWSDRPELAATIRRLFEHRPPRTMSSVRSYPLRSEQVRIVPISPTNERTNEPEPADEPVLERRTDDRTGAFVLNLEECAAVAKMIEHKTTAEKPTKASTVWAGFGVKKGDSAKYRRASEIYDALFVLQPEPRYPSDPVIEARREALGLSNR